MAAIPFLRLTSLPLKPSFPSTTTTPPLRRISTLRLPTRRSLPPSRMSYSPVPASDRLLSAVSYTLPFFNSLPYSRFLFTQYPRLGLLFDPILPIVSLYRSVPYASFIAFFALYLGVVRNDRFNRYVRFNAMQAVVLDVLLILPVLLQRIFTPGFKVLIWGYNVVFVFSFLCFIYGVVASVLGKIPYLPFVADAASRQI